MPLNILFSLFRRRNCVSRKSVDTRPTVGHGVTVERQWVDRRSIVVQPSDDIASWLLVYFRPTTVDGRFSAAPIPMTRYNANHKLDQLPYVFVAQSGEHRTDRYATNLLMGSIPVPGCIFFRLLIVLLHNYIVTRRWSLAYSWRKRYTGSTGRPTVGRLSVSGD